MAKFKAPKPNKYVLPSFRAVRVLRPEAFRIYGDFIITSRYLMGLLVEHWNKTQDKKYTIEDFRIKDYDNGQPTTDAAPGSDTQNTQGT